MCVKGNQKDLLEETVAVPDVSPALSVWRETSSGHGRVEKRVVKVYKARQTLSPGSGWAERIRSVIRVERRRDKYDCAKKSWTHGVETAWYVSSAEFGARRFSSLIRGHWSIENSNHHIRDHVMGEDASRIRRNPGVFMRLRSWALNIMRANGVENIRLAIYKNSLSFENLTTLMKSC